jgi:hypothetical protein
MVRCPYCKEHFGSALYTERLDVDELSKDTVMIYCPNPNCSTFLGIGKGGGEGGGGEERRKVPSGF